MSVITKEIKQKIALSALSAVSSIVRTYEKKVTRQFLRDRALRLHDAQSQELETALVDALTPLFKKQIESAAKKLSSVTGTPTVSKIFDPSDWDKELINRALPPIAKGMVEAMVAQVYQMKEDAKRQLKKSVKCGGPGSGVPGPCPSAGPQTRENKRAVSLAMRKIEKRYPPANEKGWDTESKYRRRDGSWTRERQALHDRIVEHHLNKAKPVPAPNSYLTGGGPASGKSSIQGAFPKNAVHIDADNIKGMLPEYKAMLYEKDIKAATFAHEESRYLAKRILREAVGKSYNTVLDGTGDTTFDSVQRRVATMRKGGRKVYAAYSTCSVNAALGRNRKRAKETGRLAPESMLKSCHRGVSRLVPQLIRAGMFDGFRLYDTEGSKPRLVAFAAGSRMAVHDPILWDRFLRKGD